MKTMSFVNEHKSYSKLHDFYKYNYNVLLAEGHVSIAQKWLTLDLNTIWNSQVREVPVQTRFNLIESFLGSGKQKCFT